MPQTQTDLFCSGFGRSVAPARTRFERSGLVPGLPVGGRRRSLILRGAIISIPLPMLVRLLPRVWEHGPVVVADVFA